MNGKIENAYLFPGWLQRIKNYKNYKGADIWIKDLNRDIGVRYIVGHSLGATYALLKFNNDKEKNFILVNPLMPKRSLSQNFLRLLKLLFSKEFNLSKVFDGSLLIFSFHLPRIISLLKVDLFELLEKIPKENITVIRGINDRFFCDNESAEFIRKKGFNLIEASGVGHNWSAKLDEIIAGLVK